MEKENSQGGWVFIFHSQVVCLQRRGGAVGCEGEEMAQDRGGGYFPGAERGDGWGSAPGRADCAKPGRVDVRIAAWFYCALLAELDCKTSRGKWRVE